jgi:hypothetical protein
MRQEELWPVMMMNSSVWLLVRWINYCTHFSAWTEQGNGGYKHKDNAVRTENIEPRFSLCGPYCNEDMERSRMGWRRFSPHTISHTLSTVLYPISLCSSLSSGMRLSLKKLIIGYHYYDIHLGWVLFFRAQKRNIEDWTEHISEGRSEEDSVLE